MSYSLKPSFHLRASSEMTLSRFIASIGFAMITAVTSLYLRDVGLSDSQIGIFSGVISITIILMSPLAPILLERVQPMKIYIASIIGLGGIYGLMGATTTAWAALLLLAISRFDIAMMVSSGAIAFKSTTHSKREFTQAQGMSGSLLNLGWTLGPLLGGLSLAAVGIANTFYISAAIIVLSSLVLILYPIDIHLKRRQSIDSSWIANMKFYISRPSLLKVYMFRLSVSLWWAFMFTFLPLYMADAGYSLAAIGMAMAATQVPLFLFEFKTVGLVKPLGYRNIFTCAYGLMMLVMLVAAASGSIPIIVGGFVIASLGIAFLEPLCELYLFDQVTSLEEERVYPVYSTCNSMGSIIGRLGVGIAIGLLGTASGYILVALVMAIAMSIALTVKQPASR